MKKTLLFATALIGFSVSVMAQEVKTTTVEYRTPTCTNCRTTTTVTTTYPEQRQVVAQPVVTKSVVMRQPEEHRRLELGCTKNCDLGIRNPLFVLKQNQVSMQAGAGVYKEPKHTIGYDAGEPIEEMERIGWNSLARLGYGITDRWSVDLLGGYHFWRHKTSQYRVMQEEIGEGGPIPHTNNYDVVVGTRYHLLDFCHFDLIVGVEGGWHRHKVKAGEFVSRQNGWDVGPTATAGFNFGWFTPYVNADYKYTNTHVNKREHKKEWHHDETYTVQPGMYFQPTKYVGFDFNLQKRKDVKTQWNAGVDVYPYKNVTFGLQLNARRPFHDPMAMYGVSGDVKVVF